MAYIDRNYNFLKSTRYKRFEFIRRQIINNTKNAINKSIESANDIRFISVSTPEEKQQTVNTEANTENNTNTANDGVLSSNDIIESYNRGNVTKSDTISTIGNETPSQASVSSEPEISPAENYQNKLEELLNIFKGENDTLKAQKANVDNLYSILYSSLQDINSSDAEKLNDFIKNINDQEEILDSLKQTQYCKTEPGLRESASKEEQFQYTKNAYEDSIKQYYNHIWDINVYGNELYNQQMQDIDALKQKSDNLPQELERNKGLYSAYNFEFNINQENIKNNEDTLDALKSEKNSFLLELAQKYPQISQTVYSYINETENYDTTKNEEIYNVHNAISETSKDLTNAEIEQNQKEVDNYLKQYKLNTKEGILEFVKNAEANDLGVKLNNKNAQLTNLETKISQLNRDIENYLSMIKDTDSVLAKLEKGTQRYSLYENIKTTTTAVYDMLKNDLEKVISERDKTNQEIYALSAEKTAIDSAINRYEKNITQNPDTENNTNSNTLEPSNSETPDENYTVEGTITNDLINPEETPAKPPVPSPENPNNIPQSNNEIRPEDNVTPPSPAPGSGNNMVPPSGEILPEDNVTPPPPASVSGNNTFPPFGEIPPEDNVVYPYPAPENSYAELTNLGKKIESYYDMLSYADSEETRNNILVQIKYLENEYNEKVIKNELNTQLNNLKLIEGQLYNLEQQYNQVFNNRLLLESNLNAMNMQSFNQFNQYLGGMTNAYMAQINDLQNQISSSHTKEQQLQAEMMQLQNNRNRLISQINNLQMQLAEIEKNRGNIEQNTQDDKISDNKEPEKLDDETMIENAFAYDGKNTIEDSKDLQYGYIIEKPLFYTFDIPKTGKPNSTVTGKGNYGTGRVDDYTAKYDSQGRLVSIETVNEKWGKSTISYSYNDNGEFTESERSSLGTLIETTFNENGTIKEHLEYMNASSKGKSKPTIRRTYSYSVDEFGNPVEIMTQGNGIFTTILNPDGSYSKKTKRN